MATVTNTIVLPGGGVPTHCAVEIELIASESGAAAGWVTATDATILAKYRPAVTSGAWSADLTPNDDIDPAGTVYRVTEYVDKTRVINYIEVGSGGGAVHDLLTSGPSGLMFDSVSNHNASGSAHSGFYRSGGTDVAVLDGGTGASTAAQARLNLEVQRSRVLDVREFGAVGDGVTDDTAAIQAALDALDNMPGSIFTDLGEGSGAVVLPSGTWLATGLQAPPGVAIVGDGIGNTVLKLESSSSPLLQVNDFCVVQNLSFDGGGFGNHLLYMFESARCSVSDCYFQNTGANGDAIRVEGTASNASSHANSIRGVMVRDIGGYGIYCKGAFSYDTRLTDVWVGTANVGMRFESGAGFVANSHIWGCVSDGVQIVSSSMTKIANCYIESNGGYGLNASTATGTRIANCDIWNNASGGALVSGGSAARFSNCAVRENVGAGITFANHSIGGAIGCDFWDFKATKTQTYGVVSTGSSDRLSVVGGSCLASNHITGAMSLVGSGNRVEGIPTSTTYEFPIGTYAPSSYRSAVLAGDAGQNRDIVFRSGSAASGDRWSLRVDNASESGADAGSDLQLLARDDSGSLLGAVFSAKRADRSLIVTNRVRLGSSTGPMVVAGSGSPEGVVTAPVGSLYLRTNGGSSSSLYVKESGSGNTGWAAK